MPAAVPIILGVTAALSAATATYQAVDANQQRKKAEGEANKQADAAKAAQEAILKQQKDQQDALAQDQASRDKTAQSKATDQTASDAGNMARDQARRRQAALRGGAGSRQSTILTSPLGDVGQAPTATRTLLGA